MAMGPSSLRASRMSCQHPRLCMATHTCSTSAIWFFGRGEIPNMLIDPCTSADGAPCGKGCKDVVEE